ncbi:HNH endonuclease signature motif containing protein [uncultured Massilia sp.]|uniref:HNH endonuclease n=1 Tax=uncultured Massilia sp. TaxID=169973 RepID=UPI00258C7223|nr:HNH endonuclease signature motif containing protein [uncultured Massilia sp.]
MSESNPSPAAPDAWSDAELTIAIKAYLRMLHAELHGVAYNKAAVNRALREGPLPNRSKGSIEFRMRNISAALYELKMPYIAGYLPATNIGSAVKQQMIALLSMQGLESLEAYVPTADAGTLAQRVSDLMQRQLGVVPKGSPKPTTVTNMVTSYVRDPAVKAWVLQAANGHCEGCGAPAPFKGMDGLPFLEVHHVMPLSSHGSDTTANAVALCPNCHRRCHYALDQAEFKLMLYERIARLAVEVPADA